jgi:hypothetical protein
MRLKPALILITMLPLAMTMIFASLQVNDLVNRLNLNIASGLSRKSTMLINDLNKILDKTHNTALARSSEVIQGIALMDSIFCIPAHSFSVRSVLIMSVLSAISPATGKTTGKTSLSPAAPTNFILAIIYSKKRYCTISIPSIRKR